MRSFAQDDHFNQDNDGDQGPIRRAARRVRRIGLPWIVLTAVIGLALGLGYAWLLAPIEYVDTAPLSLHSDYKTDYVLMVAEIYAHDQRLQEAVERLSVLGPPAPLAHVAAALAGAEDLGLTDADLRMIDNLRQVLLSIPAAPRIDTP